MNLSTIYYLNYSERDNCYKWYESILLNRFTEKADINVIETISEK